MNRINNLIINARQINMEDEPEENNEIQILNKFEFESFHSFGECNEEVVLEDLGEDLHLHCEEGENPLERLMPWHEKY